MQIKHLSKQDAICLLELISKSLVCRSEDQFRQLMRKLNTLIPYQATLACVAELNPDNTIGALKAFNVNYPDEYLFELAQRELVMKDPVLIENFKNYGMQYWADTMNRLSLSGDHLELLSLAEDFGFHKVRSGCGYAHGVRNFKKPEGSLFCFHGLDRCSRSEEILNLIIPHLHEALRRVNGTPKVFSPLTSRETEIIKWVKHGKSSWDISTILGISESTVKFHIGNIMRKLDATSRTHAVAIAMEYDLIDIE